MGATQILPLVRGGDFANSLKARIPPYSGCAMYINITMIGQIQTYHQIACDMPGCALSL